MKYSTNSTTKIHKNNRNLSGSWSEQLKKIIKKSKIQKKFPETF